MAVAQLGAGDEGGDLLLLAATFQSIKGSRYRGDRTSTTTILAARRVVPPDLICAGGPVTDLEKRTSVPRTCRRPPSFSPSPRRLEKFEPVPEPYFEQARLAHPQIHDPALVDEDRPARPG